MERQTHRWTGKAFLVALLLPVALLTLLFVAILSGAHGNQQGVQTLGMATIELLFGSLVIVGLATGINFGSFLPSAPWNQPRAAYLMPPYFAALPLSNGDFAWAACRRRENVVGQRWDRVACCPRRDGLRLCRSLDGSSHSVARGVRSRGDARAGSTSTPCPRDAGALCCRGCAPGACQESRALVLRPLYGRRKPMRTGNRPTGPAACVKNARADSEGVVRVYQNRGNAFAAVRRDLRRRGSG
jgi:hypothetical protein